MWENEPRRVRILRMPTAAFAAMMHASPAGYWYRVQQGVPPDARYLGASFDFQREEVLLKFEHESFSPVRDGGVIPSLDSPLFECKWDDNAAPPPDDLLRQRVEAIRAARMKAADYRAVADTPVTVGG